MVVVVLAVLGGLALSRLTGGRIARLADTTLRRPWLLFAAIAAQLAGALTLVDQRLALAAAALLAAAFAVANRSLAGLGLLVLGFALNAVAVVANGGAMPVDLDAIGRIDAGNGALLSDPGHVPANDSTRLRLLTDEVAVPFPIGTGEVLSVGDVLVASGAGLVVFAAARAKH